MLYRQAKGILMRFLAAVLMIVLSASVFTGCATHHEPLHIIEPSFSYVSHGLSAASTSTEIDDTVALGR